MAKQWCIDNGSVRHFDQFERKLESRKISRDGYDSFSQQVVFKSRKFNTHYAKEMVGHIINAKLLETSIGKSDTFQPIVQCVHPPPRISPSTVSLPGLHPIYTPLRLGKAGMMPPSQDTEITLNEGCEFETFCFSL